MEVILLERVGRLGHMGDVVSVKPGYARNFLLPQKKALRATVSNRAYFEAEKARLEADNAARRGEAEKAAAKMNGVKVVILRQAGEMGNLYGSVSARDISDAVTAAGFPITRDQVAMDHPIKTLGLFDEKIRLHPEVAVSIKINVARTAEEAKIQEAKGAAVLASNLLAEEEAAAEAAKAALAAELAVAESDETKVSFKDAKKAAKKSKKSDEGTEEAAEA